MSMCLTFDGYHGKITVEGCTMLGDPLVHPAWLVPGHIYEPLAGGYDGFAPDPAPFGEKETDGGCIKVDTDVGKGACLGERGFSVNEIVIDDYTMAFDDKETAYIRLSGAEITRIGSSFNYRATPFGPYIALRQDPQPGALENGTIYITAGGTAPGDLFNYGAGTTTEGWQPGSLPPQPPANPATNTPGQEWRVWYLDKKIGSGSTGSGNHTVTWPLIFPKGYRQETFDDFQYGKVFAKLT